MKTGMSKEKKQMSSGKEKNTYFIGKKITSNNQCKKCGTMDARATQHK